jgi:hypothetical protein
MYTWQMEGTRARKRGRRDVIVTLLAAALLLLLPAGPAAHEIPASVVVQALVKPEGGRLRMLIRLPLASMRDIAFPLWGPGYVQLDSAGPAILEGVSTWVTPFVTLYEEGEPLPRPAVVATRVSLPSDASFRSWTGALSAVTGAALPADTELILEQALLDILLEVPVSSETSRFSIEPEWAHLGVRTSTVLRFLPPGSGERAFLYDGNPGLVRLDPRWHQAAWTFVKLGFGHILGGIDHLLFIFCLVIPFRRIVPLLALVTSFTVAHSITLAAAAFGFAPDAFWFPPLVETLIAMSIVYMALENIAGAKLERRWLVVFAFGLVHGFGFSFLLRESLQFAGTHLALSLLAFNVGVELGQVLVLGLAVPALVLLFRYGVAERIGTILLSALVAHTAWHWMTERGAALLAYPFSPPTLDALFWAAAMRWAMLALIAVAAAWALSAALGRFTRRSGSRFGDPRSAEGAAGTMDGNAARQVARVKR